MESFRSIYTRSHTICKQDCENSEMDPFTDRRQYVVAVTKNRYASAASYPPCARRYTRDTCIVERSIHTLFLDLLLPNRILHENIGVHRFTSPSIDDHRNIASRTSATIVLHRSTSHYISRELLQTRYPTV
jgi:hypothetical protein